MGRKAMCLKPQKSCSRKCSTRGCLINSRRAKRRVPSGAKARFLLALNVGAEAPTPVATIYETASSECSSHSDLCEPHFLYCFLLADDA